MQLDGGLHLHGRSGRAAPEGPTVVARGASPGTGVRNTVRPRGADEDCLSTIIGNALETVQDRTEPGVCYTTRIVHGVLALFSSAPLGRERSAIQNPGLAPRATTAGPAGADSTRSFRVKGERSPYRDEPRKKLKPKNTKFIPVRSTACAEYEYARQSHSIIRSHP